MLLQEKDYLDTYKKQIEDRLGWGSCSEWTNQDFDTLSELIFDKTGVRLSTSTLKRVWGKVKYDSAPTITTLNTLAQFSGFENWRSFRFSVESKNGHVNGNGIQQESIVIQEPADKLIPDHPKQSGPRPRTRIAISIVLISIVAFFYFFGMPRRKIDATKITFTANVVSDDLPNSVVFNYDIADNKVDSVIIQQSWDPKRRERVSAKNHQHTSLYYFPGFFKAKLLLNNQVVKEQDVHIKTNGWKGILDQDVVPTYLSNEEIALNENGMRIDSELLKSKTGKTVFNNVWTAFYNVKDFNEIKADNFLLKTTLQNTAMKEESVCQQVRITILGSDGVIAIPLSGKGCTSALFAYIGSVSVSGKETDLSFFGCDFSKPQEITCKVRNKQVIVYRDGKEIFTHGLTSSIGKVVGIIIGFEGPGRILDLEIKSLGE